MAFVLPAAVGGAAFLTIWRLLRVPTAKCHSNADLTGKTTLVTGANCGIGYYTALDFAKRNARVILACRNAERGEKAKNDIIMASGNMDVVVRIVDLSSMKSVRECAERIIREEKHLDILVNNAGVIYHGKGHEISDEGFETMMATNHFGPFLFTNLLLDLVKASAPSRIINVSSEANRLGVIDFDNLHKGNKDFWFIKRYWESKLANILFTRELARRLKGTDVTANALCPGWVDSEIDRHAPFCIRLIKKVVFKIMGKHSRDGAQTTIYTAVSDEVEGISGKYFSDCAMNEPETNPASHDMDLAKKLWDVSAKLTEFQDRH